MTEDLFGAAGMTAFFTVVLWGLAAASSGRLAISRTPRQLRGRAVRLMALLAAAELLIAIKTASIAGDWPSGWPALEQKLGLQLALLLVPGAAALALSVPRLLRLRALAKTEAPQEEIRGNCADPRLTLPVQATFLGAVCVLYLTFFASVPLSPTEFLLTPALAVAAVFALELRQRRKQRIVQGAAWRRPSAGSRALRTAVGTVVVAAVLTGWLFMAAQLSRQPDRIDMTAGTMDFGGGAEPVLAAHDHSGDGGISVAKLTGPHDGKADKAFVLTATQTTVKLKSGATIDAWTFNGSLPGPELRVRQGDLVEVKLINQDIGEGVTLHWHGVDLPNAEDGVAGVTQDAVMPGQSYTYRFVAEDAGTYWYHSHQETLKGEGKGLFGALIVEPREAPSAGVREIAVLAHAWETETKTDNGFRTVFSMGPGPIGEASNLAIEAGTPVRLRLINTDSNERAFRLSGVPFRVAAIDGTDLNEPEDVTDRDLLLAAGGRYDLAFVMPATPVTLTARSDGREEGDKRAAALTISTDGSGSGETVDMKQRQELFDPLHYGKPADVPFNADSDFDRRFMLILGQKLGFYDGSFTFELTINGKTFPDIPMLMVREGDLVETTFINHSIAHHPMHLHGHHMLVLSRNGQPSTGSPWWTDTLDVAPGDTYKVAFVADNPGMWMDHCHNLFHAAVGMMMHLSYEGVTTPFETGRATVNHPE